MLRSWINDWNNIIRYKIFADEELKSLMNVPDDTKIIKFIDKYFIRTGTATDLLTDQSVRIQYQFVEPDDANNPNMRYEYLRFDIYVKNTEAHNVLNDKLIYRKDLIAMKLRNILLSEQFGGYKFTLIKENDTSTTMVGYSRYTMIFGSLKVN